MGRVNRSARYVLGLADCRLRIGWFAFATAVGFAGQQWDPAGAAADWSLRLSGPAQVRRLSSPSPDVRLAAARDLGRFGHARRAVRALMAALSVERVPRVRRALVRAIGRRADRQDTRAVAALTSALGSSTAAEAEDLIWALGSFPVRPSVDVLVVSLGREAIRPAAESSLERMGPVAVPALIRALDRPLYRRSSIRILGALRDARAVPRLLETLSNSDEATKADVLRALGAIGGDRAMSSVVAHLSHSSVEVVAAAVDASVALWRGNTPPSEVTASLVSFAGQSGPVQAVSLGALLVFDEQSFLGLVDPVLRGEQDGPVAVISTLLLSVTSPNALVRLQLLLERGFESHDVGYALANLDRGAGLSVLADFVESGSGGDTLFLLLAYGTAKFREVLPDELRLHIYGVLGSAGSDLPGWFLRGLAGDPSVVGSLRENLISEDAVRRGLAAVAMGALGDVRLGRALTMDLVRERSPEVFRLRVRSALRLGVRSGLSELWQFFGDVAVGPEVMEWAVSSVRGDDIRGRRRLARELRRGLRSPFPRVRAGAAFSLGRFQGPRFWIPLIPMLEDPSPSVRFAVVRALDAGCAPAVESPLHVQLRVERDGRVRRAISEVLQRRDRSRCGLGDMGGGATMQTSGNGGTFEDPQGADLYRRYGDWVGYQEVSGRWNRLGTFWRGPWVPSVGVDGVLRVFRFRPIS